VVKWVKLIIAVLLLPVCVGAASALWLVLKASGTADTTWVPILAGAASWLVVYLLLPKPMLVYVFGHELTHALWTWAMGGRVKNFKATSKGGHVIVTKDSFLIALAPYFFPLYAAIVVLAFLIGHWIWNWKHYLAVFHLFLGAAYAFHLTLTGHILKHDQTDISEQGYVFSAVIIFLGNVMVLLIGIPLLAARVDVTTALGWWLERTGQVVHQLGKVIGG
jgi:hypothetical protein